MAKPAFSQMAAGLIPHPNNQNLYIVIGILGATVMPHNLYLHSALVQTRRIGVGDAQKRTACRFNLIDSVVALNGAMLVNIAILVVAGAVFFERHIVVTEIQQAYQLLTPLLGTSMASVVFAIALLCSGQSSTMTGTMAGQIVMEGFLTIRMRPWLRRLTTRALAITPAALTIWIAGEQSSLRLLILSQVILSMQLPFAVIPLIHFTSDRKRMGAFANRRWLQALSWVVAAVILGLNIRLVWLTLSDWLASAGPYRDVVMMTVEPVLILLLLLLAWVTLQPWLPLWLQRKGRAAVEVPEPAAAEVHPLGYRTILVPLDHSERDRAAIAHAAAMARAYGSKLHLLHVEEGVTSQIYGPLSSTAEVEVGAKYLDEILAGLRGQGIEVDVSVAHSQDPKTEIIRFARWLKPDLLIMGAHGHKGIQDIVFGQTINAVRHAVDVPLLIVRHEGEGK
jgi:manganese transport protein